jgi:hypothetical protein
MLTACAGEETSQEVRKLEHGLFTAAILEPLTGVRRDLRRNAQRTAQKPLPPWDANDDGFLSVAELCRYAERRSQQLIDELGLNPQRPKTIFSVTFSDAGRFVVMPATPLPPPKPAG